MTLGIPHPGEAVLIEAAVQVLQHLLVDEAPPEPVPPFELLSAENLFSVFDRLDPSCRNSIGGGRIRVSRIVGRRNPGLWRSEIQITLVGPYRDTGEIDLDFDAPPHRHRSNCGFQAA